MTQKYILNNSKEIPKIGFGTWKFPNDESTTNIIKEAIEVGYRHFDTAKAYGNEKFIGKGLKESNINRNELFITGKLWNDDRGYDNIIKACKESIEKLQCEYFDLYLVHWPASMALYDNWTEINSETWKAFEYLQSKGLVKSIGVCNFKVHHLEELLKTAKIVPAVNQIEYHPGFIQKDIVDYCNKKNILIEAWSPLGSGKMLKKEELKCIAEKYNVSIAQFILKWCLQNGILPLPRSKNKIEMEEDLKLEHFTITDDDMKTINNLPYIGGSGLDSDTLTLFN